MTDIPEDAKKVLEWPVGEAQVTIYDPRGDYLAPRGPHKVIDASLAFFDKAEVGDRLYSREQVEEIVLADRAAQAERMARPEEALRRLLKCEYDGQGLTDCIDNDGCHYPSQELADAIANAEAVVSARTLSQEGSEPS